MLETEKKYVARELEDHKIPSVSELQKTLQNRQAKLKQSEDALQRQFILLSRQEHLALMAMFTRDLFHIAELYRHFLIEHLQDPETPVVNTSVRDEPICVPEFGEWLFKME